MNVKISILFVVTCALSGISAASCDIKTESQIKASSMPDRSKLQMLKIVGCDLQVFQDLQIKVETEDLANREAANARAAEAKEKAIAAAEAKRKRDEDRLNAQLEEDNAKREAFYQAMANKCGEYPLELKIGMSEKLLSMGCTGGVSLVGEDQSKRIYRTSDALVTVIKGRVTRWIER